MGSSPKAQELRALMGLAIRLRALAEESDSVADVELFLAAALALEDRAHRVAFGLPDDKPLERVKVDITC